MSTLVIRNAAQILANRVGVPVEKVEAVIIQMALQFAQAQGKVVTGQYIFQLANQIIQDPNGVLAQAILQLVNQDDGGRTSHTTTIIKNVIKISREGGSGGGNKQLALSISFAKETITRGSTQTVIVTVTDASTKSPVGGASVSITITYASGSTTKSFSGTTDASGKVSFSFQIGFNSTPGIFKVTVHASKSGYQSTSAKSSFKVIEATVSGPICPKGIDSCPPCSVQGNQTGINCVPAPPPPCDSKKNQTCPPSPTCSYPQYYDSSKKKCVTPPPPDFACLANTSMRYDPIKKQWECIPLSPPPTRCGDGSQYDENLKKCIPKCDSGYHYDDALENVFLILLLHQKNSVKRIQLQKVSPPEEDICKENPNAEALHLHLHLLLALEIQMQGIQIPTTMMLTAAEEMTVEIMEILAIQMTVEALVMMAEEMQQNLLEMVAKTMKIDTTP